MMNARGILERRNTYLGWLEKWNLEMAIRFDTVFLRLGNISVSFTASCQTMYPRGVRKFLIPVHWDIACLNHLELDICYC